MAADELAIAMSSHNATAPHPCLEGGALANRQPPVAPKLTMRPPTPRHAPDMCEADRRMFVQVAMDSARERLRSYRLACLGAKGFYDHYCAGLGNEGAQDKNV